MKIFNLTFFSIWHSEHRAILVLLLLGFVAAVLGNIVGMVYALAAAAFFYSNRSYIHLFILIYCIIFFSDSRLYMYSFTQTIKPVFILLVPILAQIIRSSQTEKLRISLTGFVPFIVVSLIMSIFNQDTFTSFQKTLSYAIVCLSTPMLLSAFLNDKDKITELLKVFFSVVFALLTLGIVLVVISPDTVFLVGRFRGLLGNPNGLGLFLIVVFIFFQIVLDLFPKLFNKWEVYTMLGIIGLNLILCQSRTALFTVLMFFGFRFLFAKSTAFGIVGLFFVLAVYNYITFDLLNVVNTLGLQEYLRVETLEEGSGRFVAWQFAWEQIQNNFWFGQGFAYNEQLFEKYYIYLSNLGHQGNVHNSFLTFWLDIGLVGTALFVVPVIYYFFQASKVSKVAMPAMCCFLLSANFESWLTASLNPFTIVFFMSLSLLVYKLKLAESSEVSKT